MNRESATLSSVFRPPSSPRYSVVTTPGSRVATHQLLHSIQALHYRECSRSLRSTLSKMQGSNELMSEDEITRNTEKCLADIRSLSIVGGAQGL